MPDIYDLSVLSQSDPSSGRPLTDEELKASSTDEEKEFLRCTEENDDYLLTLWENNGTAWRRKWLGRDKERKNYQWKPKDFVNMIVKTDDLRNLSIFDCDMDMNMPFTILGEADVAGILTTFALSPCNGLLWPNYDPDISALGLVDRAILGVNLSVPIRATIQPGSNGSQEEISWGQDSIWGQESSKGQNIQLDYTGKSQVRLATEQDLEDESGFPFVQIGAFCVFSGDWSAVRISGGDPPGITDTIIRGPWTITRFGVIVRLDPSGRTGAVYVVYKFHKGFPEDEPITFHSTREHVSLVDEDGDPLPQIDRIRKDMTEKFTMAKIADSFDELVDCDKIKPFKFDVMPKDELQLVRVKIIRSKHGEHRFIRQCVSDSPMPGSMGKVGN